MNASDSPHLLVVDDDLRLRSLLQRYLSANGFRVTAAADAAEARTLIRSIAFDALVLDVMMPGENGLDLAADLRAQSDVPILMLTALGEAENRIAGLERGVDDYLPKPFEPRELMLRLSAASRRRTAKCIWANASSIPSAASSSAPASASSSPARRRSS